MIGLTYDELKALKPCAEKSAAVIEMLGGAKKWNGHKISAKKAVKAGLSFSDLLWAASAVSRTDKDVERRLRLWMADCTARVLQIYEKQAPTDMRVRDCIVASRAFARDEIGDAARAAAGAAARDAAGDAARDAAWDAAWAAARDAARAAACATAGAAAGAAAWDAAWAAAGAAAWDAAWAAARAAAGAAARDAARDAAGAAEEKWQFNRLVEWLSDPEPKDLPLPKKQKVSK